MVAAPPKGQLRHRDAVSAKMRLKTTCILRRKKTGSYYYAHQSAATQGFVLWPTSIACAGGAGKPHLFQTHCHCSGVSSCPNQANKTGFEGLSLLYLLCAQVPDQPSSLKGGYGEGGWPLLLGQGNSSGAGTALSAVGFGLGAGV